MSTTWRFDYIEKKNILCIVKKLWKRLYERVLYFFKRTPEK